MNEELKGRVAIFDTTLRDGEQAPGYSMTLDEKSRMAERLDLLGADVIEAGFAIASPAGTSEMGDAVAAAILKTVK